MTVSSAEIMPRAVILSTKETARRYRIKRAWKSLSALSGIEVAGTAAELTILVPIGGKLLSAILADQSVEGLLFDLVLVAVPVGHSATIRAELLLFATSRLLNGFTAL